MLTGSLSRIRISSRFKAVLKGDSINCWFAVLDRSKGGSLVGSFPICLNIDLKVDIEGVFYSLFGMY